MLLTSVGSTTQCVFADRFDFFLNYAAESDVNTSDPGQQRTNFSRKYHLKRKREVMLLVYCAIIVHLFFHKRLVKRTLVTELRCSKVVLAFWTITQAVMTIILATHDPLSEYAIEFVASYFNESFE